LRSLNPPDPKAEDLYSTKYWERWEDFEMRIRKFLRNVVDFHTFLNSPAVSRWSLWLEWQAKSQETKGTDPQVEKQVSILSKDLEKTQEKFEGALRDMISLAENSEELISKRPPDEYHHSDLFNTLSYIKTQASRLRTNHGWEIFRDKSTLTRIRHDLSVALFKLHLLL